MLRRGGKEHVILVLRVPFLEQSRCILRRLRDRADWALQDMTATHDRCCTCLLAICKARRLVA